MKHFGKYQQLEHHLERLDQVVVAFSGGVDSTFLLAAAQKVLGQKVLAITISTPYIAQWEQQEAQKLARQLGVKYEVIQHEIFRDILNNPPQRCYLCKKHLFTLLQEVATERGYQWVIDGTNVDDYQDIRPGIRALKELGVRSPLAEMEITKEEIRQWSRQMGLPTWNKPAYACLLTRLPYDTPIHQELLDRIEKAEGLVRQAGFQAARGRTHQDIARIEAPPEQLEAFLQTARKQDLVTQLKALGYQYVTLDMEGYRMGSFNEPKINSLNHGYQKPGGDPPKHSE